MEEEGLDALLVYGEREGSFPAPFAPDVYFTNDRPGSIVILPRGQEPIAVVFLTTVVEDHIQARHVGPTGWLRPENIYVGKLGSNLVEVIEERGLDRAAFGVIGLEPYPPFYFDGAMPYNTWQGVLDDLPNARFTPVGRRFFELISPKSAEELRVLRWSASVGERMAQAMLEITRVGVAENVIYAAAMRACAEHLGFTSGMALGSGPEWVGWGSPAWTYRPQRPRVIQHGDTVLAELFCSFGMLETQHQPTIAVGTVHPDIEKAADIAQESYLAGIERLRPGTVFGEVVDAMAEPARRAGGWHVHPLIHTISPYGLIGTGHQGAELPEVVEYGKVLPIPTIGRDTVLQVGTVFAFEPNCAIGRHLVNVGGTVVVGPDGAIELNANTTRMMRTRER
ncbi:MAG TPA: M24 family metallopeptidase [Lacisediminihabitans sp.]|uniref:M24 family metallopeptidase n=1 Tax=Lacisediminihabitans sp. TaxID=2787631 RepID=UPI002ED9EDAA